MKGTRVSLAEAEAGADESALKAADAAGAEGLGAGTPWSSLGCGREAPCAATVGI